MWGLVPWPGIKPKPHAFGAWSLSHYTSREVPHWRVFAHTVSLVWICSPPSLNEFLPLPSTFILLFKILFSFYFLLCWVFISLCRLSLVVASGGYSSLWYSGFSLQWLLLLRSTGFMVHKFQYVAHGLSCSSWAWLLCGMWNPPGTGIEPVSPALAGWFLFTAPQGSPFFQLCLLKKAHPLRETYILFFHNIFSPFVIMYSHQHNQWTNVYFLIEMNSSNRTGNIFTCSLSLSTMPGL